MRTHTTISIPKVRAAQLRTIADHYSVPVSDLIDRWIMRELRKLGTYLDPPPGFSVCPMTVGADPVVSFHADGLPLTALSLAEAAEFAKALDHAARSGRRWLYETERGARRIEIRRQGNGISIRINDAARGVTASIARNLAKAIRAACNDAAALPQATD